MPLADHRCTAPSPETNGKMSNNCSGRLVTSVSEATGHAGIIVAVHFLIHDNEGIFGQYGNRRREKGRNHRCGLDGWLDQMMGIKGLRIPYGIPVANAQT